jgi:hypothetical protein
MKYGLVTAVWFAAAALSGGPYHFQRAPDTNPFRISRQPIPRFRVRADMHLRPDSGKFHAGRRGAFFYCGHRRFRRQHCKTAAIRVREPATEVVVGSALVVLGAEDPAPLKARPARRYSPQR